MADVKCIHNVTDRDLVYASIDDIPDVLLLNIFSRLCFVDLCKCSQVCCRWYRVTKDFSLKKRVIVKKRLRPSQFANLVQYHFSHHLQEFQLLKSPGNASILPIKKNIWRKLSNQSSNLKKLVLISCCLITVSLKELPPSLVHLSVRGSEFYPDIFFHGVNPYLFPNLTCLDLGAVSNCLTSQDLRMFSNLKSLRSLYLEGCFRINNGGIELIIDILPQLEILDVEATDISNEGVQTILNNCINIKELYVGHTSINDGAFPNVLQNKLPGLSFLCFRNTNITSVGLHAFLMLQQSNKKIKVEPDVDGYDMNEGTVAVINCHHILSHKCKI